MTHGSTLEIDFARLRLAARAASRAHAPGGRMDAGEAIAREQIRDVISRYNHAGDRGDLESLARCFREDGVLDIEGEDACAGRAAILRRLSGVVSNSIARGERAFVRHHVSSVKIDLTGPDSATAASYFLVFTEIGLDHWGRYLDRLSRSDGDWQFAHRKVRLDGVAPDSSMVRANTARPTRSR